MRAAPRPEEERDQSGGAATMRAAARPEEERGNRVERRRCGPRRVPRSSATIGFSPARYAGAVSASGKPVGPPAPVGVRGAGLIVALQGATGLVVAAVLLFRAVGGADQRVVNGFGTAGWFVLAGGAVLAAGCALLVGRRWGRGLAVLAELLLLPVSWYLTVGSHRALVGIPVGIMALTALALLLSPAAIRWAAGGDQRGPARSANSGPDSR